MWDFPQFTSGERAFNGLYRGFLEAAEAGAGVGAGVQASKIALRIRYKSFLEYWRTSVATADDFGPKGLAGCLKNSDFEGREELRGATIECSQAVTTTVSDWGYLSTDFLFLKTLF